MNTPKLRWSVAMARPKETVNLDGLIRREDVRSREPGSGNGGVLPAQLELGQHYYGLLRKPNFQRETDDWGIDNVVSLIKSFRDGHLIPAVILWAAKGNVFVIDGAHRLSVFIAWVNDDYGDRSISEAHFKHDISQRQRDIAKKCREQIASAGLTYAELNKLTHIQNRTDDQMRWSTNVAKLIEAQWVPGNADTALQSFLDINQRSVVIDRTERYMIEEMGAATVTATRAIISGATGYEYWGAFKEEHIRVIEAKARLIYDAIFEPEDAEPHKDTELQPAGASYMAGGLRLTLDLVNMVNGVSGREKDLPIDSDGSATERAIEKTWGIVKYIGGDGDASLDLFPAVYFWGDTGNHRPSAFLAMALLIQDMIANDELRSFTMHRARFEEYLAQKNGFVGKILKKHGGWKKSLAPTKAMFRSLLNALYENKREDVIEKELTALLSKKPNREEDSNSTFAQVDTWRETKAALRIKAALDAAPKCPICKARMVLPNASSDHMKRRADGGSSGVGNGQLTHPFCNTGFKNYYDQRGEPLPVIPSPV